MTAFNDEAIPIRIVTTDDELLAVRRLRYDVYVKEQGKRPSGLDHGQRIVIDELDEGALILAGFLGNEAVATGRVIPLQAIPATSDWRRFYMTDQFPVSEDRAVIYSKLMIREGLRGSTIMPQLLIRAYEHCREDGIELGFLHCAPSLVTLFEMLGCRRYQAGRIDAEVGLRLPMVQLLGDTEHFASIRSPLIRSARKFSCNTELATWFQTNFPEFSNPSSVRLMNESQFYDELAGHFSDDKIELFSGLEPAEVQKITRASSVFNIGLGEAVLRKGDAGKEMFIVLDGAVEIMTLGTNGERRLLATLGNGQFFGEGGFLLSEPRSADTEAIVETRLLSISSENFHSLLATEPHVAAKFLSNLSKLLCRRLFVNN